MAQLRQRRLQRRRPDRHKRERRGEDVDRRVSAGEARVSSSTTARGGKHTLAQGGVCLPQRHGQRDQIGDLAIRPELRSGARIGSHELLGINRIGRAERAPRVRHQQLLALLRCHRLTRSDSQLENSTSDSRNFRMPRRTRVFTVPSGSPVRSAISTFVRPPKYADRSTVVALEAAASSPLERLHAPLPRSTQPADHRGARPRGFHAPARHPRHLPNACAASHGATGPETDCV